jgi:hypothetical protein
MRKIFIHFDNINSFGYVIKKVNNSLYLVYIESTNQSMEIESKYIRNLDFCFR